MTRPPGFYVIRIGGRLGPTALSAFPSMTPVPDGEQTVLSGVLEDSSAVFGLLAQLEAMGLELLEFRRAGPGIDGCGGSNSPHR
jgi:hypothetical protein